MKENANPIKIADSEYRKLVEPYKEEAFNELKNLIAIDSVLDESTATKEMPFGKGVEEALSYVAKLGERLSFKVDRCDNYVTELTYGEGDKILDIYGHVDVVPVDKSKWEHDPFKLTLEEGNIMYGRGTSDDKGPAISCLFAVKALMDKGLLGGYKLRFLFGGNEETGSLCLDHYFHHMNKVFPTLGFSPDAEYPLIYAEKSIYAYRADYKINLSCIPSFAFGQALNIVIGEASLVIDNDEEVLKEHLEKYLSLHKEVKAHIEGKKVTFLGKPVHGSTPWLGVNAALHLINFLGELYDNETLKKIYKDYIDGVGENFGGNFKDEDFTETSYNVGKVEYKDGILSLFVNLRFPSSMKEDTVLENLRENSCENITSLGGSDGFVSDKNSAFISTLLKAYQEETLDYESKPLAIGGGTYARESKNSVAFGAQFIGRDYRMHGNDEFFPLSDFYDNMQIYAHAINELSKLLRKKD